MVTAAYLRGNLDGLAGAISLTDLLSLMVYVLLVTSAYSSHNLHLSSIFSVDIDSSKQLSIIKSFDLVWRSLACVQASFRHDLMEQ